MQKSDSVTVSKAIAILLMVLAHSGFSQMGDVFINMFHMPLFFFMSGYCFKDLCLDKPLTWLKGKIIKLYWPYVKYSLLFLLLHNVFYSMHIYSIKYTIDDIIYRIPRIIIAMGMHDQLLGGYWFMGALFWGLLISFIFLKIFKNNAVYGMFFSLLISMVMNATDFVFHFINIQPHQFFAASFILAGIHYKRSNLRFENKPYIVIPVGLVLITIGTMYWPGNVVHIDVWKMIPYFITALGGTMLILSVSRALTKQYKCQILKWIGGGTLEILTWHFLCFKCVSFLIIIIYSLPIDCLSEFPVLREYTSHGWWMAYFVVSILLSMTIKQLLLGAKILFQVLSLF